MSPTSTPKGILASLGRIVNAVFERIHSPSEHFMEAYNTPKQDVVRFVKQAIENGGNDQKTIDAVISILYVPQRLGVHNNVSNARDVIGLESGASLKDWISNALSKGSDQDRGNVAGFAEFAASNLLGDGAYVHPTDIFKINAAQPVSIKARNEFKAQVA